MNRIEKWLPPSNITIYDRYDELYHHAKFGEIEQRTPAVGAKTWCLFIGRTPPSGVSRTASIYRQDWRETANCRY